MLRQLDSRPTQICDFISDDGHYISRKMETPRNEWEKEHMLNNILVEYEEYETEKEDFMWGKNEIFDLLLITNKKAVLGSGHLSQMWSTVSLGLQKRARIW